MGSKSVSQSRSSFIYIYVKYDHEKYIVHIEEEKLIDKKLHISRWNSTVVLNSLKYFKFFRYFRVILISIMIYFIIIRNRCFKFLFRGILFVYRFDRGRLLDCRITSLSGITLDPTETEPTAILWRVSSVLKRGTTIVPIKIEAGAPRPLIFRMRGARVKIRRAFERCN